MSKGNALRYLIPVIKARLIADLAAVPLLSGTAAVPVFEWGAVNNEALPRVVIGNDNFSTPMDTYGTYGSGEDVHIDVYDSSDNNGVYDLETITDLLTRSLNYKANCGTAYPLMPNDTDPEYQVIAARTSTAVNSADPDTKDHRKLIIMRFEINQVA